MWKTWPEFSLQHFKKDKHNQQSEEITVDILSKTNVHSSQGTFEPGVVVQVL